MAGVSKSDPLTTRFKAFEGDYLFPVTEANPCSFLSLPGWEGSTSHTVDGMHSLGVEPQWKLPCAFGSGDSQRGAAGTVHSHSPRLSMVFWHQSPTCRKGSGIFPRFDKKGRQVEIRQLGVSNSLFLAGSADLSPALATPTAEVGWAGENGSLEVARRVTSARGTVRRSPVQQASHMAFWNMCGTLVFLKSVSMMESATQLKMSWVAATG